MKRLYITLIVALFPVMLFSQAKQINDIFDRYEDKKGITSIQLNSKLIGAFIGSLVDNETKELVSKINSIRILNVNNKNSDVYLSLRRDLDRLVESGAMESIINIKDGGDSSIDIFVSERSKEVLLFMSSKPEEFAIISMFGLIDKNVINAVIKGKINIR